MLDLHIMIIKSDFNKEISDRLLEGALAVLEKNKASHEVFNVPGIFEIPAALQAAIKGMEFAKARRRFSGYIALGCAIEGETDHYRMISESCFQGLSELSMRYTLALGNGILTVKNYEQGLDRADMRRRDAGGAAAEACLGMLKHKGKFSLFPRER